MLTAPFSNWQGELVNVSFNLQYTDSAELCADNCRSTLGLGLSSPCNIWNWQVNLSSLSYWKLLHFGCSERNVLLLSSGFESTYHVKA